MNPWVYLNLLRINLINQMTLLIFIETHDYHESHALTHFVERIG
jgi:hypothetical protein